MWDGLYTSEYSQVTIVAATNCPEQLDDAILRRLSVSIHVGNNSNSLRILNELRTSRF